MKKRVVVTGLGMISPLGQAQPTWKRLLNKESGIVSFPSDSPSKVAATIPTKVKQLLKNDKQLSPFMQYAMFAAHEALQDANWFPTELIDKEQTVDVLNKGVCIGSGIGSMEEIVQAQEILLKSGMKRISPFFVPRLLVNLAAGQVSIKYGFMGPNHCASTACSTGAHSIGDAARFIEYGDAKVIIAGGTEASISPLSFAGFGKLRALSTVYNDDPIKASRPFDKDRDGFVIGEGAGMVVLEELEHAKARGARIYAEVVGYGLSGDAHHITSPPEDGSGAARAMKSALKNARLDPSQVDYINAHATSTPLGDVVECKAIQNVFGFAVAVSSTKGAIGHLLGAAGAVESIFAILAVHHDTIPPTLNLENIDEQADIVDHVQETRKQVVNVALSNSFGFGGTNASLVFKKYSD